MKNNVEQENTKIKLRKRIFNYISPVWSGKDGHPSIRRILAIAFSTDFIFNVHNSVSVATKIINLIYKEKAIDAGVVSALSTNLAQITLMLGTEAALIAALLGLTTWQNIKNENTIQNN